MTRWISTFLEAQSAERGSARTTVLGYGRDLRDFAGWLAHRDGDFAAADRAMIEAYLVACDAEGLSRATRARRLSSIRQLFRFAYEEGWRADNPALRITGPGRDKRLPKTLSEAEVEALLQAARSTGRVGDRLRNTCLMELLYATGMRVSELVSLPASAARGDPRMLLVRGKGGKERMVPLSGPARTALAAWLKLRDRDEEAARAKGAAPNRQLFPARGRDGHLTRQSFFQLIKRLALEAGLDPAQIAAWRAEGALG